MVEKKRHICEKDYVWNLLHVAVKMENVLKVLWMIQQLCMMKL